MSSEDGDDAELRERVTDFLSRNFPQIQMHGGTAVIEDLDPASGAITLRLAGACSGCGISPMTVQAIKSRMVAEFPEIETVYADAEGGQPATSSSAGQSRGATGDRDDPPF